MLSSKELKTIAKIRVIKGYKSKSVSFQNEYFFPLQVCCFK